MSAPWVPPRRGYHLRLFAASLGVFVFGLTGILLGVRMEAVAPATGSVTARDLQDVRTLHAGLIEPGWYDGEAFVGERTIRVRLDAQGNGVADPAAEGVGPVIQYEMALGLRRLRVPTEGLHFHRLHAGDELWPGQVLASLRPDERRDRLQQLEADLREWRSGDGERLRAECEQLRRCLAESVLHVPDTGRLWLAAQVKAAPFQAVQPGDVIVTIVPLDPDTRRPRDLVARLEIEERHCGEVAPGQVVRLFSTMHDHRLHGHAEALVERIEPWGEPGPDRVRRFVVVAPVTDAPFPLALGSTFKAEVVLGRKVIYRIILEH